MTGRLLPVGHCFYKATCQLKIKNTRGISNAEMLKAIEEGGRFVHFQYTFSLLIVTIRKESPAYFIRRDERPVNFHLKYTLLSLLLGWWGVPFGPLYTLRSIRKNISGGKDVTNEVMAVIAGYVLFDEVNSGKTANFK